jgi:mono/diheme cytochrome c family protein
MRKNFVVVSFALTLLLSACGLSLAEDITPPPSYKSPVPAKAQAQTTTLSPVAQPLLPPDPVQGAAYYAEKCVPCHGVTGRGDGPQATKLGLPVPAIGTVELARRASPAAWYDIVTNGRMDKGMPPFRSLNDRQRWDVLAYTYTLSTSPASVQQGKTLYDQKCASCHGPSGRGNGPDLANSARMPDWGDPGRLAPRSASDLVNVINSGVAPAMPAYASQLSEDQRWALADYIRTLSFANNSNGPVVTPDATSVQPTSVATLAAGAPTAAPTLSTFKLNIAGKVSQTNGAALPGGLKVAIQGYDDMAPVWAATTDIQADGSYRFADVEVKTGRTFLAVVEYKGVPFQSDPLHAADLKPGQDASLPISLSEVSNDLSAVSAQRMHVFFDFSQAGKVQVAELFILINTGDKAVASAAPDQPLLRFTLPDGAEELAFQDGALGDGHYVQTDTGFGDLSPILPKDQLQVLFAYLLPYPGQQTVSLPLPLPVESTVVMVPSGGVTVQSSQLTSAGVRNVDGMDIQMFTASSLKAGAKLDVTLSGLPSASGVPSGTTAVPTASSNEMLIAVAVFGVVLLIAGVWLYRRRGSEDQAEELADQDGDVPELAAEDTRESLLDAIVALDDLYQAGQLPEIAYQERRADLKARLAALKKS